MSKQSFADLGVSKTVVRALAGRGIDRPFPVQEAVIPDALDGRDVLVESPTGSGKTLAFGVAIADRIEADDPRCAALVLVPTRELAAQIVEALREILSARALSVASVYGGVGIERQAKLARRAHVVVATPGRLEDLIARGAVRLDRVRVLVLDEADRMLDMGFRPVVDRIVRQTPRRAPDALPVRHARRRGRPAGRGLHRAPRRHEQRKPERERGRVEHRFLAVAHEDKLDSLVQALAGERATRTLVFVRTKRGADRLVKRLARRGVEAAAMHGDKSQSQRERALRRFDRGDVSALVATDVAARGIDVEGITQVVNFDAPEDRDTYVHRVGRTGRAGRRGLGVTFVMADQAGDLHRIASELRLHAQFEESGLSVAGGRGHCRAPHAASRTAQLAPPARPGAHLDPGGGRFELADQRADRRVARATGPRGREHAPPQRPSGGGRQRDPGRARRRTRGAARAQRPDPPRPARAPRGSRCVRIDVSLAAASLYAVPPVAALVAWLLLGRAAGGQHAGGRRCRARRRGAHRTLAAGARERGYFAVVEGGFPHVPGVEHRYVDAGRLRMHVAEAGERRAAAHAPRLAAALVPLARRDPPARAPRARDLPGPARVRLDGRGARRLRPRDDGARRARPDGRARPRARAARRPRLGRLDRLPALPAPSRQDRALPGLQHPAAVAVAEPPGAARRLAARLHCGAVAAVARRAARRALRAARPQEHRRPQRRPSWTRSSSGSAASARGRPSCSTARSSCARWGRSPPGAISGWSYGCRR